MTDGAPANVPTPARPRARAAVLWARVLGVVSVVLFFVPLIAPLVQAVTFVYVLFAASRGSPDRISVIVGAGGSAMGFVLFLATECLWVI